MDHGQQPRQHPGIQEIAFFSLIDRAVQQIQGGKQYRPAKQSRPLGQQHIHDHIDPADISLHVIGGSLVKTRKDPAKVFPAPQKIEEPEAAVEKEQRPGKGRLPLVGQQPGNKEIAAEKHLGPGKSHRQEI